MSQLTLQQLESHLWKSADILRGSVNSNSYKNYIFGLLFLKRTSDVFEEKRESILSQYDEEIGPQLAEMPTHYRFFVPEAARWDNVRKVATNIGAAINIAFEALENENDALTDVLTPIDFNNKEVLTDETLQKLLQHFSQLDLRNANLSEPDMLGRAYEYLIKMFADDAGQKGGEFYTPLKVVELIINLIKPLEGMRVYDPTCGSGGMLIHAVDYVKAKGGNPQTLSLYGQEKNLDTWAIAKLNLLLHNLPDHLIKKGDTLRKPRFFEEGELMLFDRVIANPPFSLKEWGVEEAKADPYGRYQYGIPPKSYGDYAFIQHMIASLNCNGIAGVVMPHGVLFRGGAEGKIRKALLEQDLIEAVIGLPSNLFYGTSIPASILIFNRNKPEERQGKVMIIAAEDEYQEGKNQNILRDQDIKKITATYEAYKDVEKYARVVTLAEIKDNDYNLNITRYIDKSEEEEQIDIQAVLSDIQTIQANCAANTVKLNDYLKELGFGENI